MNWAAFHTHDGLLLHQPLEVLTLDDLVTQHQPQLVILGHEPTGVYHESRARNLMIR